MPRSVARLVVALVLLSIAGTVVWMLVHLADHPERTEQTTPPAQQ